MHTGLDNETKKNFAKEAGAGKKDLSALFLSGSRSGRDEYSGGENEGMEDTWPRADR